MQKEWLPAESVVSNESLEVANKFCCYLGDMTSAAGAVAENSVARIRCG